MSYVDYVRHLAQKYRAALSIAVLRSKPEELSLEGYIQQLRDKIREEQMDSDLISDICSDDFQIDETGVDIDEDNYGYDRNNGEIGIAKRLDGNNTFRDEVNDIGNIYKLDLNEKGTNIYQNSSKDQNHQSLNDKNDEIHSNEVEMINTQDLNDSVTILQNFEEPGINTETERRNSYKDVMELLKGIDDNMTAIEKAVTNKNISQLTHNHGQCTKTSDRIDIQCLTDNDATFCRSLDISSNIRKRRLSQENNNSMTKNQNTNYNREEKIQKVDNQIKSKATFQENDGMKPSLNNSNTEFDISAMITQTKSKYDTKQNTIIHENTLGITEYKQQSIIRDYRHTKEFKNIYQNVADIFSHKNNKTENSNIKNLDVFATSDTLKEIPEDLQESVTCSIPDEFICNTHYSESQVNDLIIIDDKYIHGINKNKTKQHIKHEIANTIDKDITNYNDMFSKETSFTNVPTLLTINSQMSENNTIKHVNETNIMTNNIQDVEKYTKRRPRQNCDDVSSQESQLTNIVESSMKSSLIENHNDKRNREAHRSSNNINSVGFPEDKQAKDKVKYIDNDWFSQESQITNFLTNNCQNILVTGNSFVFTQDAQNMDEYLDYIETQKLKVLKAQNNKDISVSNDYTTIDKNLKNLFVADDINTCTNFDKNLENIQLMSQVRTAKYDNNSETMQVMKAFDRHLDSMQVTELTEPSKIDEQFKHRLMRSESFANFDKNLENIQLTSQVRTVKHDNNSETMQVMKAFDRHLDSMQVTELTEPFKIDEEFKHTLMRGESYANFDKNLVSMVVEEEMTDSQMELIPFKVIEELNKVKMYINRINNDNIMSFEGHSSDAGYRSDSQSKNSLKMSQSSSGWLNQAAHNLFNYITECTLEVTTQDVTNEISVVLGQLIDKLHEEEKYPSFLEELLDTVQQQLGVIYDENRGEHMLMKKDETIQRIILLNKSIHIQKYTIEKITYILENLHSELSSDDSLNEIENIDQLENTCYIFHILEIILHKYVKTSQNLSGSTQNSQEDEKILKRVILWIYGERNGIQIIENVQMKVVQESYVS